MFWALGWPPSNLIVAVRLAAKKQWKPIYFDILNNIIQNCKCKNQEAAFAEIAESEQKNMQDLKEILIGNAKLKIREQLLPHLGQTEEANNLKAKFLAYLVWKILILGENTKFNDVSTDTKICIQDTEYEIPDWMKLEREGDVRIKKLHRDHLANTVSGFIGKLLANLLRQVCGLNWKKIIRHTKATLRKNLPLRVTHIFKNLHKAASRIQYCVSSGRWAAAKDKDYRQQVTQAFSMQNHIAQESHFTYHSTSMNPDGRHLAARQLNRSHIFNLCPSETPETKKCGLTGHSAQSQEYTIGSKVTELEETLTFYQKELFFIPEFRWIEIYNQYNIEGFDLLTEIILTGKPIGYTQYPERFIRFFYKLRRTFTIDLFASISYYCNSNIIQIRTDRGRTIAPFLIMSRLHHLVKRLPENYRNSNVPPNLISAMSGISSHAPAFFGPRACLSLSKKYKPIPEDPLFAAEHEVMRAVLPWPHLHTFSISSLLSLGLIDYLDASERKMSIIAMQEADYWLRKENGQLIYTHIAIDPHFMFSVTTGLSPYIAHSQSTRSVFNSALAKSKAELALDQSIQLKTKYEAMYCQFPLAHTLSNVYRNGFLSLSNITPFTAFCSMFGFSNDDAQNLSWPFTRRGAGITTVCRLFRSEKKRKKPNICREAFEKPNPETCTNMKFPHQYNKLLSEGIVPVNTKMECNDVIIGQTTHLRNTLNTNNTIVGSNKKFAMKRKRRDTSIIYPHEESATVSSSLLGINFERTQTARVQTRATRPIAKGDKGHTESSQKGTISYLVKREDSLELANGSGIHIEYYVASQAIFKRMTIAMPIEMLFSTAVALGYTRFSDATSFRKQILNLDELLKVLKRHGFSIHGSKMRCGHTGKMIQAYIFCGFVRYGRLKHMQIDKLHARARGPVNFLTRQPTDGKAKNGGLRFGEMERSCACAYPAACVTHQQTHEVTDAYRVSICPNCHYFAVSPLHIKKSYCQNCKEKKALSIYICYSYKILTQLLMSLLIFPQIHVAKINPPKYYLNQFLQECDLPR